MKKQVFKDLTELDLDMWQVNWWYILGKLGEKSWHHAFGKNDNNSVCISISKGYNRLCYQVNVYVHYSDRIMEYEQGGIETEEDALQVGKSVVMKLLSFIVKITGVDSV